MLREKRRRQRNKRLFIRIILIAALAVAVCFLLVWKVFTVQTVKVSGNTIYSDEQIEEWVLDDEYSWNTIYDYVKYKFMDTEDVPFVDSMSVSILSPHKIKISVSEKSIIGYVYVSSLSENAYIDKDGFVVELSTDSMDEFTKISGLEVTDATLYEKIELENSTVLDTLLQVTQLLKKYDLPADLIYVDDDWDIILVYDDVQVNLGDDSNLNEKVVRMEKILPKLDGMTGTLHLESWTETNTDIVFDKKELIEIPDDVQSVPQ